MHISDKFCIAFLVIASLSVGHLKEFLTVACLGRTIEITNSNSTIYHRESLSTGSRISLYFEEIQRQVVTKEDTNNSAGSKVTNNK